MKDILYINDSADKDIVKPIDEKQFFELHFPATSRRDLFNFAVALGYKEGVPADFQGKRNTFVRTSYYEDTNLLYLFAAIYFRDIIKSDLSKIDQICDENNYLELAEKYANSGFALLNNLFQTYPSDALLFKLIGTIDQDYKQFKTDFPNMQE